jgi:acyl-coenzyme A synthetase/AMP-(fatty) acid ligase
VKERDFPSLKRLLWAGEVLPTPVLIHWMKRLPHVAFTNLYGPTETTIASSYYTVPRCPEDLRAEIPIGTGCGGEEVLVLNKAMQPVPPGTIGDIYIGGVGIACEDWRDPDRTAAAFVTHPLRPAERIYRTGDLGRLGEDGLVYFVGRSDTQIKSRGYRIELGEIEAALHSIAGVDECAVVALETDSFAGAIICCAFVSTSELTPTDLRRELKRLVPSYMLPARWLALERFPKNANGKIDRRNLKEMFTEKVNVHDAQCA